MRRFPLCALALLATLALGACRGPAAVDRARLLAEAKGHEQWLTTGGDYGKTHYSGLAQIDRGSVARLGYAWGFDTNTDRGLEATPIVVDGVMYTSGVAGRVYALDAGSGRLIWRFEPHVDARVHRATCCDQVNRGVAVWQGKVYVAALDGVLYALDAASGRLLWRADTIIDHTRGYSSTGAPEVAGDVVVIGNAGGEFDTRGYITAYDLKTGRQAWRFFTAPGKPSPGKSGSTDAAADMAAARTWDPHSRWDVGGGGNVWDGMVYDPDLDLLYVATGNGEVYARRRRSPSGGDNLYLASVLAIRPGTGRLVWSYQETPGDEWDYDSAAPMVLATLGEGGRPRRVLMHAPKNGFFYVLDRATGALISAKPYVRTNWASGADPATGRMQPNPDADYSTGPKLILPSPVGGHVWNPMAFSPDTGLVYIPAIEGGGVIYAGADQGRRPGLVNVGVHMLLPSSVRDLTGLPAADVRRLSADGPDLGRQAFLRAWDPRARRTVWQVPTVGWWDHGGVLATRGGLVFQGSTDGHLRAYDDATGRLLKDIDTGSSIIAAPMSYAIGGVQYVAVMAAAGGGLWYVPHPENAAYTYGNLGRILVFRLDGGPTPKPPPLPPLEPMPAPPPSTAPAATVARGQALFAADCASCHVNLPRSASADLTRLSPAEHAAFDTVVLDGGLEPLGMPRWDDVLSRADADAIHAYLIKLSNEVYAARQGHRPPPRPAANAAG